MKFRGFVCLGLLLTTLLVMGVGLFAQDDVEPTETTEAVADQSEEATINLEEGLFALMVVAVVMMGLTGFEYIHRRKRSL